MPERDRIDLHPGPQLLMPMFNANLSHWKALAEWIDNSFDAAAANVRIEFGPRTATGSSWLTIKDDGVGCADLGRLVTLGKHTAHSTTRLGRYGVGAKDAAAWYGGPHSKFSVASVHGGKISNVKIDWHSVLQAADWPDNIYAEKTSAAPGDRGTTLHIAPTIHRPPDGADWQDLLNQLGYIYAPAINRGRQILIGAGRRTALPIAAWKMPQLSEQIDTTLDIGGRSVRIKAGIVADGESNPRHGLTYWHAFRVIKQSRDGCGNYSTARICGVVELDQSWPLTRNKDDLSGDSDDLYQAVFTALHDLLLRAETQAMHLETTALSRRLETSLRGALDSYHQRARAKRSKGATNGTKEPTGRGPKHQRAEHEQSGDRFKSRDATRNRGSNSLRISFTDLGDPLLPGQFNGGEVMLNTQCPAIILARDGGETNELAIVAIAITLIAESYSRMDQKQLGQYALLGGGEFIAIFGRLLAETRLDGREVTSPTAALVAREGQP